MSEGRIFQLAAVVVLAVMAFTLFVADQDPSEEGRVTLRFLHVFPVRLQPKLDDLIAEFERRHPNIKVQLERAPGRYYTKVQTMMVGDTAPDVLAFSGKHVKEFAQKRTLLNLMPYIKRDGLDLADYFPVGLVDAQMTDDSLYYLPWEGSGSVLYFNKDMFDAAELSYPNRNWTWDDFRQACKALTRDIDGDGRIDQAGLSQSASWWGYALPWVWAAGGRLVDTHHTQCLLDSPEAVQAMQFLVDLEVKDKVTTKALGGMEDRGRAELFASGRVAMFVYIVYGLEKVAYAADKHGMQWDVTLVPKGPKERVCRYTSSGQVIWSGTKHPEESWELLKFLHSPEFMRAIGIGGYFVPARKSVAESKDFIRDETPWREEIFIEALKDSRPLPNLPEMRNISVIFREETDKATLHRGALSVEGAMRSAANRANAELRAKTRTEHNAIAWLALGLVAAGVVVTTWKLAGTEEE